MTTSQVRYDPVWRRIKVDTYARKLEGKFPDRFRRLENLNNWGVLSWLYPHAKATKQDHHLGVERNAVEFLGADSVRTKYRPSLRLAAHVLHWGHVPLSYGGAEAILRAAHVEPQVEGVLDGVLNEVVTFGSLKCKASDHAPDCFGAVKRGDRPFELYKWLAAWLLAKNWSAVWQAVKSAEDEVDLHESTVKQRAVRALVCREDRGYRVLQRCNLADYVPRDLLQSGTAWLTVDIEALWEDNPLGPEGGAKEWALLEAAVEYLEGRFYATADAELVHSLAARILAQAHVAEGLPAGRLRALLDSTQGDMSWQRIPDYHRRRMSALRESALAGTIAREWVHVGTFSDVGVAQGTRLQAEDELSGRKGGGRLSYPFTTGVSIVAQAAGGPDLFAGPNRQYVTAIVHHRRNDTAVGARPALDLVANIRDRQGPFNPTPIGGRVLSWLTGKRVEERSASMHRAAERLAKGDRRIRAGIRGLRNKSSVATLNDHGVVRVLMDAIARDETQIDVSREVGLFALRLPWSAAKLKDGKGILEALRENALSAVNEGHQDRGSSLEVAVAADQLLHTEPCVQRFLILGATELDEDGSPLREWDVIRVDLRSGGDWSVTAVECAVSPTGPKNAEAQAKLDDLRNSIKDAFPDLSLYDTKLATVEDGHLRYADAGRDYRRDQ